MPPTAPLRHSAAARSIEAITALALALSGRPGCGAEARLIGSTGNAVAKDGARCLGRCNFDDWHFGRQCGEVMWIVERDEARTVKM